MIAEKRELFFSFLVGAILAWLEGTGTVCEL